MPAELHTTLTPDTPVRYLKGVGPKTAERCEQLILALCLTGDNQSNIAVCGVQIGFSDIDGILK